ncbi:MAG: YlxR family protein [Oscillospiraceae bacterium]|nr:YlxR family protein [Oscillospiraceae bacterium]
MKKEPIRMCTGCGARKTKADFIRIVKSPEKNIFVDETGKKAGRGAYICKKRECFTKAQKAKRLERVFKCKIEPEVCSYIELILTNIENGS